VSRLFHISARRLLLQLLRAAPVNACVLSSDQLMAVMDWIIHHCSGRKADQQGSDNAMVAAAAAAAGVGRRICQPAEGAIPGAPTLLSSSIEVSSAAGDAAGLAACGSKGAGPAGVMAGVEVLAPVLGLQQAAAQLGTALGGPAAPGSQLIDDILPSMQELLTDCS